MAAGEIHVLGIGLVAPGLPSWPAALPVLRGEVPHAPAATVLPPLTRLPPAERRRASGSVKVAMAAAEGACGDADVDPAHLPSIFTASGADGANCHALCEALGSANPADRLVSPTRFTNSVHNAAAGYWHITAGNRQPSTSLCAHDESFAAGLVAAFAQLHGTDAPLLLVASDTPYPQPLQAARPLPDMMGVALVLQRGSGRSAARARAVLSFDLVPAEQAGPATACLASSLEDLRPRIPAGRALPLLEAIALRRSGRIVVPLQPQLSLRIGIAFAEGADR